MAILRRELRTVVEGDPHRGRVGLNQNVRDRDLVLEIGAPAGMIRVLVSAQVVPGPAEEGPLANPRDVIGDEIVAPSIPLVDRAPQVASLRMYAQPDAVAQTAREDPAVLS